MAAAVLLTIAVIHVLVAIQRRASWVHLLFALTAMAAGGNAVAEAWVYGSNNIESMTSALRWYVNMSGAWAIALIWFIVVYTQAGRIGRWLAAAITLELAIALAINVLSSSGFIYTEITSLRQIRLPWGEVIWLAQGDHRSAPFVAEVTLLAAIFLTLYGCRRFWRLGQRQRAWMFGTTVIVFMTLFATHATLVDMSVLDSPYLSTYGFLGVVLVISYDMAREVARASVLSQEVLRKDADMRAAVDEERRRIAGDLHDSVTQTLFSTAVIADALPDVWDRYPEEARRGLNELRQLTKGALAEMRSLLLELHPTSLLEKTLGELLQQLADATVARTRIPVSAEVACDRILPDAVQVALYRVAQEGLNNAMKHAQAASVRLSLNCDGDSVILVIRDDGRGFDPQVVQSGRLGLSIMRERIRLIGAKMQIKSKTAEGTTIRVVWPGAEKGGADG
jgi:signal transduction histidine kinase